MIYELVISRSFLLSHAVQSLPSFEHILLKINVFVSNVD